MYASMQHNWNAATQLFDPPFERVQTPYGNSWLPGYFLRGGSSGAARPTVILNNGSDGQNVDLLAFGGAAALERGDNALIFEGPGQGSMLFERQIFFRPGQGGIRPAAGEPAQGVPTFTVAGGAEYHDAPMAPQTRNQVVFDWLDGILG